MSAPATAGTIVGTKNTVRYTPEPARTRVSTIAAAIANTIPEVVPTAMIQSVFRTACQKFGSLVNMKR